MDAETLAGLAGMLEDLIRLQPKETKHLKQAADLYASIGNYPEASKKLEQLLKMDPKNKEIQDRYLQLRRKSFGPSSPPASAPAATAAPAEKTAESGKPAESAKPGAEGKPAAAAKPAVREKSEAGSKSEEAPKPAAAPKAGGR